MSCTDKMEVAIKGAPLAKGVLDALGGAKGVAIALGVAAVLQFVPVAGEIEDVIAAISLISLSVSVPQIYAGLKELYQFKQVCCKEAKTPADLNKAGVLFADAVGKIGVNALVSVLGVKALKGTKGGAVAEVSEETPTRLPEEPLSNGLPAKSVSKPGWPNLPAREAPNFTSAQAVNKPLGTKLYRVIDNPKSAAGSYWSDRLPESMSDWRSDYAVKPEWNQNGSYVEYTVTDPNGLNVWEGPAANQGSLAGGAIQIWMPPGTVTPGPVQPTGW